MDTQTKNILRFIAEKKYWNLLHKDKHKALEYSKEWLREQNSIHNWGWKAIVRASKYSNCVNLSEFKILCNHYKNNI